MQWTSIKRNRLFTPLQKSGLARRVIIATTTMQILRLQRSIDVVPQDILIYQAFKNAQSSLTDQ